jgi:hypothetical protein
MVKILSDVSLSTSTDDLTVGGTIELGHATDTTLSRSAAGTLAVEGVDVSLSTHTHTSFANNLQINKADSKVQLLNTTSGSGTEDGMYLLMADTNVGYLWNAETNGALVFGTGGAERARITPAGKLGIGTNAPSHQLEVVGPASVTVGVSAGGAGFAELELVGQAGKNYITSDDTLSFDIGGTERATVATTGLDVTSGTLSQGGTAVSLSGHTHSTSNITSGNFAATVSGGTGVTVTGGTGNASTPSIAIGQAVATSSSPTFAEVTTTGAIRTATGNADPAVYVGDDALIFDADTADTLGIQGQQTATNGAIVFGSGKDTNLYRGGANLLETDDAFEAGSYIKSGMTAQRYSGGGSAVNTTGVGTDYVDISGHTVTFTPNYIGQRWLITYTASSHTNNNTDQYIIYQVFVDGGNLFFTRTVNIESGINYTTNVSGMDVYTSVGTSAVVCKVGVRMQSSTNVTVSTYYGRLNAVPLT